MYCNRCGSDKHFAVRCPTLFEGKVEPESRKKIEKGERRETVYMRSWREKNRDRYNAYQRELMRKRRAGL